MIDYYLEPCGISPRTQRRRRRLFRLPTAVSRAVTNRALPFYMAEKLFRVDTTCQEEIAYAIDRGGIPRAIVEQALLFLADFPEKNGIGEKDRAYALRKRLADMIPRARPSPRGW